MQTLNVDLGNRSYPIHIGPGLLDQADLLLPHLAQKRAVIVTNTVVAPLYLDRLTATLQSGGVEIIPVILPDGEAYKNWETLNLIFDALLTNRVAQFADLGIGKTWETLTPEQQKLWNDSLPALIHELRAGLAAGDSIDGWVYPPFNMATYGDDDDLRARVALGGLAALPRIEAIYVSARTDGEGHTLTGTKSWRVKIPARLPVGGFWSLTMYEEQPDGRLFFVPNAMNRFAIGDRSNHIRPEPDGSIELFVQAARPSGERVVNWLPAPKGNFVLMFRAYLPGAPLLDGSVRLAPITEGEMIP